MSVALSAPTQADSLHYARTLQAIGVQVWSDDAVKVARDLESSAMAFDVFLDDETRDQLGKAVEEANYTLGTDGDGVELDDLHAALDRASVVLGRAVTVGL